MLIRRAIMPVFFVSWVILFAALVVVIYRSEDDFENLKKMAVLVEQHPAVIEYLRVLKYTD